VAFQAQGPDVLEITLATAFHHGNDVVGIPQAFSQGRTWTEAPIGERFQSRNAA
jgi:hypothetical protein